MNITIARLRSFVKYNGPLETVLDSFFENYVRFQRDNPQHNYRTYNVSFDGQQPKRIPENIEWADVIVIPSDSEFRYHGELQMNPKDLAKSQSHIERIAPFFKGKDVIMWRSDRGDTEELYRSFLPDIKSFQTIDEVDFSGNIHGMKYHFIQTLKNPLSAIIGNEKTTDFAYWGRMKHGNDREKTIRKIYRSKLSTIMIGGFPSGIERQSKWIKDWKILYPMLEKARCTLCFNWIDQTATTSRYPEALSIGMIPFVWRDYDSNNTYNIEDYQRVETHDEFIRKALALRDDDTFERLKQRYRNNYSKVLLSEDEYYNEFSSRMSLTLG
ncbi:MAG: hypothetical protein CMD98_06925 [Gammaproteobacteria bacterium]|nr:hypothetical protein [Gammaproteobacteria bacterium]|tara:strand:+ start:49847 stop:50827 length:981 start_codon:yes stop_codon:yes gene_type:complete